MTTGRINQIIFFFKLYLFLASQMIKEILIYKIVIFFKIKLFFDFFYKLRALNDVLIKQIRDLAIRARVYESVIFIPRKL